MNLWHLTVWRTLQQNGVVKRINRTLMDKVHCMHSNAGLPKLFWAEAASTTCFLVNWSPSSVIDKKTRKEVWSSTPADFFNLKIFECPAYAHIDNGKLESIKYVFLGYKYGVKGYKLWCLETNKVIVSRDVIFDETAMLHDLPSKVSLDKVQQKSIAQMEFEILGSISIYHSV